MNRIAILLFGIFSLGIIKKSTAQIDIDGIDFNEFEIYELVFFNDAILSKIDVDSVKRIRLIESISQSFDKRLSPQIRYFNKLQLDYFITSLQDDNNFPRILDDLIRLRDKISYESFNIREIFGDLIEYPDQSENVITGLLIISDRITLWDSLMETDIGAYYISTYNEYGYEEFRYFPSLNNELEKDIANKISAVIKNKFAHKNHPVLNKFIDTHRRVQEQY